MASRVFPTESEAQEAIIERMLAEAYCCLPGVVEEFNASTQIAMVTPAIQRKIIQRNGKPKYEKMKQIIQVPVVVPYVQKVGLLITLPIAKGDEGLIVFSDRMIDNFVEKGGFQPPECCGADNQTTEPRAHSLTDAIFIPGVITKPNAVKNWNNEALEIRNKDRTCYFSMNKNCNITIQTNGNTSTYCANAEVNATGAVNVSGRGGVHINPPSAANVTSKGNCCCAGSCSNNYSDSCCGVTPSGNMCCGGSGGSCASGATSNCMTFDDITKNLKIRA